ncbi:cytochrome b/b6 domain-containing protein [Candidatus Sulfurimonas marisnigri]|uniref:Cytochrome b/b6 domain-containing protein n=1 Tax=Candidatus Sulfurimonas marisnigri TaxID=2740405 RepID=A0A7S7M0I1_9BACT|nr:cytochrome b/b6 domain-containing protein [Candidatus Sulfurimonas marisnigri]QOY54348.1 cytochrome b/b6 domain-containing protein [Candidatus Sulfurimonas marisnigri]
MKYTVKFRVWHWLNAIVVIGLLGTVFLRKTFLSWRINSEILMTQLSDMGVVITAEQAKILAKAVRAGMWEWHIIFGYALAFLIIYRICLFIKDSSLTESFASLTLHKKAVKISYYVIYATLIFMALSGLAIHFHKELQISKELAGSIKDIHEIVFYVVMIFVPLHIAGVIIADATDENGVISTMINGKKAV